LLPLEPTDVDGRLSTWANTFLRFPQAMIHEFDRNITVTKKRNEID